MPSKSFPPSTSRAKKPFEKIHSDLKSFPVESYHRYKYFIAFFDDYTSHGWIVLLRKKDDAIKALRDFVAMVKTQFNASIKEWMSDGGGEFKSEEFDNALKELCIKILQSIPRQPQQNGRAERFIRTIMDKAQALRFDACLPESWWEFSVSHAVHLYNRTPVRRLKWKTPYELLHKKVPDISHLCVFGCGAYVYLPEEVRKNKLSPKSELMVFLGYPEGMKGYLFMRFHNNSLFRGATAVFDETYFPKCPGAQPQRGGVRAGDEPPPPSDRGDDNISPEGGDDDDFVHRPNSQNDDLPQRDRGGDRDDDQPQDPPPPALGDQPEEPPAPEPQLDQPRRSGRE